MDPVTVSFDRSEKIANWRALLHGIMAIPYMFVFMIIAIVTYVTTFIAFFAVLFTGTYPDGLYKWATLELRAQNRLNAYMMWFTEEYPPFDFDGGPEDNSGYAVTTSFNKPDSVSRFAPLYQWLIVLPVLVYGMFVGIAAAFFWMLSFFTVLFAGSVPASFARWMEGSVRVNTRVNAYAMFLHNEYPDFSMD